MKRIILILTCIILMTFSAGCSVDLDNLISKITEETNTLQEQETPIYQTIITALENDDFELFKSVYSDYALENAVDIEQGFEYMSELYTGEFIEITHSNTGGGTEYLNHSRGWIMYPSFGIRTDEKYYILHYAEWGFPEYESASGVHWVQLVESTKEDTIHVGGGGSLYQFPGVRYPENEFVDVIRGRIMHFLSRMEDGIGYGIDAYNVNIRESMSDELLATEDIDKKLTDMQNYCEGFHSSDLELSWRSKDLKSMYFWLDDYDSYLYIRLDDEQPEKMKVIQIVKKDGDKPIDEYDFEDECGIYLPK